MKPPLDSGAQVPSFENGSDNFVEVVGTPSVFVHRIRSPLWGLAVTDLIFS